MDYLAGQAPDDDLIDSWVEQFHRDGCLFLRDVLPPDWCAELRRDLDLALEETAAERRGSAPKIELHHRLFETSEANLQLFDIEPIVTFAERLVAPDCHVIHNNSFRSPTGGGLISWHQDDAPHFEITHGEPPDNVRLPVLLFTCNYYLTDVETVANGPTQTVPRSHLFGARPPNPIEGSDYADQVVSNVGLAGSVIMFNNQVWHRGAPNTSQRTRYITQISYARRLVGHKYYPFMNYQMPEHVYAEADERRRRLLGFLPRGAYG
jgi:ectoine hydroxylase-related dioxygenase (phytanoyl-CoA dioxygenase family)